VKYRHTDGGGVVLDNLHVADPQNLPLIQTLCEARSTEAFVQVINQVALRRGEIAGIKTGEFQGQFAHGRSRGSRVIASAPALEWPSWVVWVESLFRKGQ
jgi:hypothetical protein